ncbi:putative deoxyribonuclease tatd [Erysiphe necator]|uniref:Putative deoxyribonuclease tatd n=1 Tax=Uncinula necator TaxID=52586 RepID=A0A0B1P7Y1_UNCNE|nr:putative deoxyribonuclease tatd [Erysiphe necator]
MIEIKDSDNMKRVWRARFVDIGINLTDPVYQGIYNGKSRHPPDLSSVITRAQRYNCDKLIVTGSDISSSQEAVRLAREYPNICYATVGVHPCSCTNFTKGSSPPLSDPSSSSSAASVQLAQLSALASSAKASGLAVAFGEIGLDYDRLELCSKEIQIEFFERQLSIAVQVQLPLFLHSRAAHTDFMRLLSSRETDLPLRGVVHSFTGSCVEMKELTSKGWHIGVNGCSLKTSENCDVVRAIPLQYLHLETDGPWCEIRPSHAGAQVLSGIQEKILVEDGVQISDSLKWMKKEKWQDDCCVKGRNEPCTISKVAWAVAAIKGLDIKVVVEAAWENSLKMFQLG